MDTLSNILRLLNLRASVYFHAHFCGAWSIDGENPYRATFHMIARGNCWLHMPDQNKTIALRGGDLIVFPRDIRHSISGTPSDDTETQRPVQTGINDNEPETSLICGYFDFDSPQSNPLLDAMPDVIHIRNEDTAKSSILDSILRMIATETEYAQPGAEAAIDKLSELLFIQVIRAYMEQTGIKSGFLAALFDPKLSKAIQAVHKQPGFRWNVLNLAEKSGMSRSTFASRFQEISGMTPMQYVTNWRMQNAFEQLRGRSASVAQIAEQSGYQTEASFRKAFKKELGIGPGAVRRGMLPEQ